MTDGSTGDTARNAVIALTGSITGNQTVHVTAKEKWWIIDNQTSGAYTVNIKVSGQTGVTWAATDKGTKILYANGTDVIDTGITSAGTFDLDGDELTLDADADTSITASTDDQIDFEIAGADDFTMTANAFNVLTGSHATFADSANAKFGTGNDMLVYHDGSNSYITNATGALKLATETSGIALTIGHTTSETTIADNLTTTGNTSVGGTLGVTGVATFATHVALGDSDILKLGAGTDLTLYHDGSNSYITNAVGALKVATETSGIAITLGHSTSEVTVGDNLTVIGNLNVTGTETIVDSNVVNISDNIIQVNTGGAKRKGGLQVIDTDGDQTGSVVWDSDGNYFEVGLSGSEYRLPELSTATELSGNDNRVLISDGTRIDASAAITDDGTTVDISNRVDAQASLQVTGSIYVSAGASVAASLASLVSFRNNGTTQLGYLASANTSAVTTGLVGYNASTGNLTISSVIDGGSF